MPATLCTGSVRSELLRQEALVAEVHEVWEDQLERRRVLAELRDIEHETVDPLLARADAVVAPGGEMNCREAWDRGLMTLIEVLDAVEAAGAARGQDEVTIELDACGDLENLISLPHRAWVRMTQQSGPGGGWPVVEVHGSRAEVRDYVAMHWGQECVEDLEEAGEL